MSDFELNRVTFIEVFQKKLIQQGGPLPGPGRISHDGIMDHPAGRPGLPRRPLGDRDEDNFNPDGSRKDNRERKPRFEVELLCRTFVGDVGYRPLSNIVFWESPDIWIEGPSGDPDIATPGILNQVKVHVWNLGLAYSWGTQIDLFWCDPSVGISPALAHHIGTKNLPLAAGQHKIVNFDWVPELVNSGHECLVAQVYDPINDPVVAPFNPVQDRHVAQRNVSVVELEAGSSLSFPFFTQNLTLSFATTDLEVQKLEQEALSTLAMALGRNPWGAAGGMGARISRPIAVQRGSISVPHQLTMGVFRETLQGIPGASKRRRIMGVLRETAAVSLGRTEAQNFSRTEGERGNRLHLGPGQHFKLALETILPSTAHSGSADVYRIVERVAGQITGGITVVVQTK